MRRRGNRALLPQALRPPAVLPLVIPEILEVRQHLAAEQIDVLEAQFVRHRAEVQERKQVTDAQALYSFNQLVAHGGGTPRDEKAALDEVLVLEPAQVEFLAQRRAHGARKARMVLIARDRLIILRGVEQLVEEIFHMRGIFLRGRVGLGYADQLQETQPVGIGIAAALRDRFPEIIAEAVRVLGAVVAQMTEAVVPVDHELDRGRAARARDPDRGVRLLDRPWPEIDHGQLIMPAVPGENFLGLPRLEHQRERFTVALALLERHDTIRDGGIGRQSGREARNEPPAADAVEHGVFLGDARWRTGRGQCGAELDDRDVLAVRELGQHRAHQARIGHETVDVLMVLIGAQSVHPGARGMDEFIQCPVVVLAHLVRVGDIEPDRIDIGGLVALAEIARQVAIGHQMEHADFHGSTFTCGELIAKPPVAPRIKSLAFSAIMITAALMLPPTRSGKTEASITRRPCVPCTRRSGPTTAMGSYADPIRQVPAGWCTVTAVARTAASSPSSLTPASGPISRAMKGATARCRATSRKSAIAARSVAQSRSVARSFCPIRG